MTTVETGQTEIPADPPPAIRSEKVWVSAVQKKQSLTKYDLEISTSEGKHSVTVPADITEKANPLWEDFVVARFLDSAPHIAKVHMIINKIWAYGEKFPKLEVYPMDEKTMRIRVTNAKIREKVIKRGMWNVAGVMMVASKWSPDVEDLNASLIPLWVHLTNVPMSMYSWEGLSFMTSAVGVPDHLHPETIACSDFEVAKVFVKADLTKELPEMIDFTIQGKVVTVGFDYPWLPPRCVACRKWGHYETFCKEKKKEKEVVKEKEKKEFKTPTSDSSKVMKERAETQQSSGDKQESSNDETSKTNVDCFGRESRKIITRFTAIWPSNYCHSFSVCCLD